MAQSKVTKLEPVIENGNHGTWSKDDKTFYKFTIELEDGTKGQVLGVNIQGPAYSVNSEVTYELVDGKIKNVKKVTDYKPGGGSSNYYNDPLVQKSITANICIRLGILACKSAHDVAKDDYFKMANAFVDWCWKDSPDNQLLLNRRAALEQAVESSTILKDGKSVQGIDSGKAIFAEAERILDWVLIKMK